MVLAVADLRNQVLRWNLSTLPGGKARFNERFRTKNSSRKAISSQRVPKSSYEMKKHTNQLSHLQKIKEAVIKWGALN